jgi:ParB family chromosome partitioning protein
MSELESNKSKKNRLGRGLDSLLGGGFDGVINDAPVAERPKPQTVEPAPQKTSGEEVLQIPVEKLFANTKQPRKRFEKKALEELSLSIQEQGIIQPIIARKIDNKYEIIAGERRWRASQLVGLEKVPVLIKDTDPKKALELALIENIQRENLNPVEEAEAYVQLIKSYGLTQQEVAQKVGKERATIANSVRLLALGREIREMIESADISVGHAKVLMSVEDPAEQRKLAQQIARKKLSVRAVEQILKKKAKEQPASPAEKVTNSLVSKLSEDLQKSLGTKVHIDYKQGKGKIQIQFYSDDQLNQLAERFTS